MTAITDTLAASDPTTDDLTRSQLQDAGVRSVMGTMVNASGLTLAKTVPIARLGAFHRSGMGAAPVWHVFTIDGGIAFTDSISAVGDMRLRLDLASLRNLGDGRAWAPTNLYHQDGRLSDACARGILARVDRDVREVGYTALVGHELEFVLTTPDGQQLPPTAWVPYGVTGLLEQKEFLDDLLVRLTGAGIHPEQIHAEYGRDQFELSLPPAPPVQAADDVVLTKIILGIVARAHGMQVSFSPSPFPGSVGNGAHQHFSLSKNGESLFGSGTGPHGITDEGGSVIAGIIAGLPDVQGLLTGSILSGVRLAPGTWSGAYSCWGLENREASVRYLAGGVSNPHGSNVEVKIVDPSANVYLGSAAILALALNGIRLGLQLPSEISGDPGALSDAERSAAGVRVLSDDPKQIIDNLNDSLLARRLIGDEMIDIVVAARRYEQATFAEQSVEELADRFRLAWSI